MSKLEHLQLRASQLITFRFLLVLLDRVPFAQLYYFFAIQVWNDWLHWLSLTLTFRTYRLRSRLFSELLEDGWWVWYILLTVLLDHRNKLHFIIDSIDFSVGPEVWSFPRYIRLAIIDIRKHIVLVFIKFLDAFLAKHILLPGRFRNLDVLCSLFFRGLLLTKVAAKIGRHQSRFLIVFFFHLCKSEAMALHGVRVVPGRSATHSCFSSHVPGQDRSSFVQRDVICYFLLLFTPWTCLADSVCIVSVLSKLWSDALLYVLFVWAGGS